MRVIYKKSEKNWRRKNNKEKGEKIYRYNFERGREIWRQIRREK